MQKTEKHFTKYDNQVNWSAFMQMTFYVLLHCKLILSALVTSNTAVSCPPAFLSDEVLAWLSVWSKV